METVLRAASMYLLLMVVLKVAGRRTLMEMTSFDLILLLIISEATQQALLGDDFSITGASITIITLIVIDIMFGMLKTWFPRVEMLIDGTSLILVEEGNYFPSVPEKRESVKTTFCKAHAVRKDWSGWIK